jgi:hypothetical protein
LVHRRRGGNAMFRSELARYYAHFVRVGFWYSITERFYFSITERFAQVVRPQQHLQLSVADLSGLYTDLPARGSESVLSNEHEHMVNR